MELNDIFTLEQYDEAYEYVSTHDRTTIADLGDGKYQITIIPQPNDVEVAEMKRATRDNYLNETDKYVSVPDFPISESEKNLYIEYRKYLRDLPGDSKFPYIDVLSFDEWKNK